MDGFPRSVREVVFSRAGGRCERCGLAGREFQYHHRRPRGMGGSLRGDTNTASNCVLVCLDCHNDIESNRTHARERGFLVSQRQRPAVVPLFRWQQWVLLGEDGDLTLWSHPSVYPPRREVF